MKINRRTFIAGVGATVAAAGFGGAYLHNQSFRRPNIILFIADDMRYDAAGFAGSKLIKTPYLDALAKEGFVFDNSFVTTSICPISRASIMSGEYALRHHVYTFFKGMKPKSFAHSFPVMLRKAGYHTGFIGKWGQEGVQPVKAFDKWMGFRGQGNYYWSGESNHLTDVQTKQAIKFLETRPKDKPFLLIVAYKSPHGPWIPQKRFDKLYNNVVFPRSKLDTKEAFANVPNLLKVSDNKKQYNQIMVTDEEYQRFMRNYSELITGLDESIGIILSKLQSQNEQDQTSVLFTSDNGLMNGDHGLLGKWNMYESSIRVPLIVKPAKTIMDYHPSRLVQMALNIDISPTILSMASVPVPKNVQGMNLMEAIRGRHMSWRGGFYYEHPAGSATYHLIACDGYRTPNWKYTRYHERKVVNECLFDLVNDPNELSNLARDPNYAAKLDEMRKITIAEKNRLRKEDV